MNEEQPFADLPAALVDEMLSRTGGVAGTLLRSFLGVRTQRQEMRKTLADKGLLLRDSDLGFSPIPTTCAVDGGYALERMLATDLAAYAALAVEGLTPPSEERHWEHPHHSVYIQLEEHHPDTATILRATMVGVELLLATQAPHDTIMLDGTLALPIIYMNQALARFGETEHLNCSREFRSGVLSFLEAYATILSSERSDRNYLGLPKYSTRQELGKSIGWRGGQDDRGFLSLVLEAGELTRPLKLQKPDRPWHLGVGGITTDRVRAEDLARLIVSKLEQVQIVYYKPYSWLPAMRLEMASGVARNPHRLASVIQALKHQCATPGMLEPYPLFMADRMVKALSRSIPTFRQVATQHVAERYEGDVSEVFFGMHGYRSEAGR